MTSAFDENRAAAGIRDPREDPEPAPRGDAQLDQRAAQLRHTVGADPTELAADGGGDDPDAAAHELDDDGDEDPAATDLTTGEALRDAPPARGRRRPPALQRRLEERTHDPRES